MSTTTTIGFFVWLLSSSIIIPKQSQAFTIPATTTARFIQRGDIRTRNHDAPQGQIQQSSTTSRTTQISAVENDSEANANESSSSQPTVAGDGLYKVFAQSAWQKLHATGWFQEDSDDNNNHDNILLGDADLRQRQAAARGMPAGSVVDITIQALMPKPTLDNNQVPVAYARYALLETKVPAIPKDSTLQTQGIQVLNVVVFPNYDNHKSVLPVWSADFVSLPGGKHLLLLDAQPMHEHCQYYKHWNTWYRRQEANFPWGGDLPPPVAKFVSPHALWTRMTDNDKSSSSSDEENANDNGSSTRMTPVERIQTQLLPLFEQHLDLYLELLSSSSGDEEEEINPKSGSEPESWFDDYLHYRLNNDPARPMLKSLYGEDWTERALHQVLFPTEYLLES